MASVTIQIAKELVNSSELVDKETTTKQSNLRTLEYLSPLDDVKAPTISPTFM